MTERRDRKRGKVSGKETLQNLSCQKEIYNLASRADRNMRLVLYCFSDTAIGLSIMSLVVIIALANHL